MALLNLAPDGINNPTHTHPRVAEVLTVVEGEMHADFLAADGTLFARVLYAGDAFVFPNAGAE
jgi:mannose-6-phosphate isomerase-like protein (cupin superfamily)